MAAQSTLRITLELGSGTTAEIRSLISQLLDAAELDFDQRVEVLGAALVTEAVRPYWEVGNSAEAAHENLRRHDPEVADAIEAIAPMLYARAECADQAAIALDEVERLLGTGGAALA